MAWSVDTLRPLLVAFDERVRRDVSRFDRLLEPAARRGSVLRDPATEAQIARAEDRLGLRLPPSYRAFLLLSNGAHASSHGAELDDDERHGLLGVDQVRRTVDADPRGVRLWCEEVPDFLEAANDRPPAPGAEQWVGYYLPYRHGLLITHIDAGANRLALVPRDGVEEWELWDFTKEGATAHASFADFLRSYLDRPDARPRAEDADELVELFVARRSYTLDLLAEIDDRRAVDLARRELEAGTDDTRIALLLGRIGDAGNIPVLRDAYERATAAPMRGALLDALDRLRRG